MLLLTRLAWGTCTPLVNDDLTDFSTDGAVTSGRFDVGGWVAEGGYILYNLPSPAPAGEMEIVVRGLEEAGVGQSDLAEMFSGFDGSFTDSAADQFLQLKFAGDVYDGYDGRIKLQLGMEYGLSGTSELAEWSDMRDWSAGDRHTLRATWGDGWSTLSIDGAVAAEVDYTEEAGGYIPFQSLRIPNNGSYTYDPLLSQLTFEHVSLCGELETAEPAAFTSFDIQPRELTQGDVVTVTWSTTGPVDSVVACAASGGTQTCTGSLGGASGSSSFSSGSMAPGTWSTWMAAGSTTSSTIDLVVRAPGTEDPVDTAVPVDTAAPPVEDTGTWHHAPPPGTRTPTNALGCGLVRPSGAWVVAMLLMRRASRSTPLARLPPP